MSKDRYHFSSSNAFVDVFTLEPYKGGVLDGLTFAVKDNIDVRGYQTTYGSKVWASAHDMAVYNALCLEQLLGEGQPVREKRSLMNLPTA